LTEKTWKTIGKVAAIAFLAGIIFFLTYFDVKTVEVMDSSHYTADEIKEMTLKGFVSTNSVLAPIFCTKKDITDIPFVESYTVTRISNDTICVSVKEKKAVGCIPYLDSYIYFDRNGIFIEGSKTRDETVPYFNGIEVSSVIMDEKLPIKGTSILNTAVALATIFQKNDNLPDYIQFDSSYQLSLIYGDITVMIGKDQCLEDKMARVMAILPLLEGEKGILHVENVTDSVKTITFEREEEEITAENWNGGYDENGDYTGDGEYTENGRYVGARPMTALDYALQNGAGGYDEEGDYTGWGEYDAYGNYIGSEPTEESMAEKGDWTGGYNEYGGYDGISEYDREGYYVGPYSGSQDSEEDSTYEDSEEEYGYEDDSSDWEDEENDWDDEDDYYYYSDDEDY
jgi:cell division protein FtsQ